MGLSNKHRLSYIGLYVNRLERGDFCVWFNFTFWLKYGIIET